MSLPIGSLLRSLAGESRRSRRERGGRWGRGVRRPDPFLLSTEPLEARSMLAVSIAGFVAGGAIQVISDDAANDSVRVVLLNNTVPGVGVPPASVVAAGISLYDQSNSLLSFGGQTFFPIVDPVTSAVYAGGVQITGATTNSTAVTITDTLTALTNVTGAGTWTSLFSVGGQSGQIQIVNPVSLTVSTGSSVAVDGVFAATAPKQSSVSLNALAIVAGKSAAVSADFLTLSTSTGAGTIALESSVTASDTLTLSTNSAFDISQDVAAANLILSVKSGATQSGGTVTGSASFRLTAGGAVTLNNAANNLATITAINSAGQDIAIKTTGTVTQSGAILARSLSLVADGPVTLTNSSNKLDAVAITAAGDIAYTDFDALQIGVAGGLFGLSANGGAGNVTVKTNNDLTQTLNGAILASTFNARLTTGAGGLRKINLDSPNNQVSTFAAQTNAGGGAITFVNAPNRPLIVGDGTTIQSGGSISITTQGAGAGTMALASPLSTPAAITLKSGGDISQVPAAKITANSLDVTNGAATGGIVLNAATGGNDVAILSIKNSSTGAANGISFTGSNAASSNLQIAGTGIASAGGNIEIDANGRKLLINAGISAVGGNVTLVAASGISQAAGGIAGNTLSVTNNTSGAITLTSQSNDVATLAIKNNDAAGSVSYTDANDLTLTSVGAINGINAGDSIALIVGGNFSAPAGTGLTAGGAGKIDVVAGGTVTLSASTTAGAGASFAGSGVTTTAAINGGAAGSVSLTATTAGVSVASVLMANQDVVLVGPTFVTLGVGSGLTASAGRITATSAGGGFTSKAGVTLNAATDVSITSLNSAIIGGPVSSGNDFVVTATGTAADVVLSGAVLAGGAANLTAGGAVSTKGAVNANSFTSSSGTATTLGAAVTTAAALTAVSGGTFGNSAALTAGGALGVTSAGDLAVGAAVQGATVTLNAGNGTSPAGVTVKSSVTSTTGAVAISASGGTLSTAAGGVINSATDATFAGTTGVNFGDTVTAGGNVKATASAGDVGFGAGAGILALTKTVTLTAATGIGQDVASVGIQAAGIVATNGASGAIALDNPLNDADTFRATNAAAGATLAFVDADGIALALPGTSTNNGSIDINAGGGITVTGTLSSGTADTTLTAVGGVLQAKTGTITANKLGVDTGAFAGGAVTLNKALNKVAIIYGQTQGGDFSFTGSSALQIGVANVVDLVTTAGGAAGANIYVAAGQGGSGALLVAADSLDAGNKSIGLQAKSGISDLATVTITADTLILANTGSGGITLSSPTSVFANLAAQSVSGSTVSILDNGPVVIDSLSVSTLTVAGIQVPGGTIVLNASGAITQTAAGKIVSKDATFISTGLVDLNAASNNNVANLSIQASGEVQYLDFDSFAVGVGGVGVVAEASDITLESKQGAITLNADVSTTLPDQDLTKTTITAAGSIIQTAGQVISGDLVLDSKGGSISLAQPTNDIANLRATAIGGAITFVDATDFEVGLDTDQAARPTYGVVAGKDLSLTAGPTITPLFEVGLLRVTEGLAWLGTLSLKAGLDSRIAFVDFAVTGQGDQGAPIFGGSLRNMIQYANFNTATQTINGATRVQPMRVVFDEDNFPVETITLGSALPAIVKPLDINGTLTEATVVPRRVGINGGGIPATSVVNGLVYAPGSNDSRITGLAVHGFATGSGIRIASAGNSVTDTYAGLQRDGITISANKIGIELTGVTATSNTIGTVTVNELAANVIGGNTYSGIVVRSGATANAIVGNFIGTDIGNNNLGNTGFGISLESANGNVVGTRNAFRPDGTPAASNVITNNNNSGVRIFNSRAANASLGNLVENNRIDANGTDGVEIVASAFQTIGGQQARQANVITRQVGNAKTGGNGISVTSSTDINIFANFIGVDEAGSNTLGNARAGVLVDSSARTVISAGNRIGRNSTGVRLRNGATATRIEANYIGTNEAEDDLGNTVDGVEIDRSSGNFVRFGNVIAFNDQHGVNITDSAATSLAAGNVVSANTIRRNGTAGVGAGVRVAGGARTTIGGLGVGNVITANANEGILVETTTFTGSAVGMTIQGNYVGTSKLEEIDPALANTVGIRLKQTTNAVIDARNVIANSTGDGVRVEGSSGTTFGSATSGQGNVVTTNAGYGVLVTANVNGGTSVTNTGNNVFGNTITGNGFGTLSAGGGGVLVRGVTQANGSSTTSAVIIGRSAIPGRPLVGQGNTITGNAGNGVTVDGAQGVLVQGNSIFGNTGLPIANVNAANSGAIAPTLTSATVVQRSGSAAQVTVQGSFVTAGVGTVNVVNGRATFSTAQSGATVGSVVMINGTGYRITQVISSTVVQLAGNPSTIVTGTGRVASRSGVATFSVPQAASLVGQSITVAGRSYVVTSLSANGTTGRLAGNPTFLVSSFTTVQSVSFGLLAASVLGQQYVIDIYLNDPADGTPGAGGTGTGYGLRRFLGQAVVTVGPAGPGTFTVSVNLPAGVVPAGQYVTATASTMRAATGTTPFSTSQATSVARQLVFARP